MKRFCILSFIFVFWVFPQNLVIAMGQLQLNDIIKTLNEVPLDDEQIPKIEEGSFLDTESIYVNGEEWSFRTAAPSENIIVPTHPRLMLTQEHLPDLREKLLDSVYAEDMKDLEKLADKGYYLANAFLYAVFNDTQRGMAAKERLLKGNFGDYKGYERSADWIEPALVFDWIYPLLSNYEKTQAFDLLKKNINYDHRTSSEPETSWYWNDEWARHKPLYYPILALAIYNDGIDNVWADEVINLAYGSSSYALGPYSTDTSSGFLDVLMTLSLGDGGGEQSGMHTSLGDGYYSMHLHSMMPLSIWQSATSRQMWSRSHYFQKMPQYWTYAAKSSPANTGLATLEYITGIYKTIDEDAASLAKWLLEKYGRSSYHLVFRLIHGDLRVTAKSPEELGLPTAQYIKGADLFTSRTSWDDSDSVVLSVYSRYLDTSRYEPYSGVYAIYKNEKPLLVRGMASKTKPTNATYSGLWIYDSGNGESGQGSTYWGRKSFGNYAGTNRAVEAFSPVSEAYYFPGGPDTWEYTTEYRAITQEYSRLLSASPVHSARNTIVHIPDGEREFVVVYDYAKVGRNLHVAASMRLAEPPQIEPDGFWIDGMNVTVISPENAELGWVGGLNNEFRGPAPKLAWYGNNKGGYKPGYSSGPQKTNSAGLGNLYIYPTELSESYEFLSVIEISDLTPLPVTKISDSAVEFGQWKVSFSPNGEYDVIKIQQ